MVTEGFLREDSSTLWMHFYVRKKTFLEREESIFEITNQRMVPNELMLLELLFVLENSRTIGEK